MIGATTFSKIDVNEGYQQLELHPDLHPITTFSTYLGLFRYKRLSFGTNSAAEIFPPKSQKWFKTSQVPTTYQMTLSYTPKKRTILTHLKLFNRLREHNLTIKKDERNFRVPSLEFFGHVFSARGVTASDSKLSAIIEAEPPETVSEVRSPLGMAQYVARFILNSTPDPDSQESPMEMGRTATRSIETFEE